MSPGGRSNNGAGRNAGPSTGNRGGSTSSNGGAKRDGVTTNGDDSTDGASVATFTPGQNGTLTWNTTQAIDRRPILVYVFDGHAPSGENFEYSRNVELSFLKDKDVVAAADDFVCEKLCIKESDFLLTVPGREPVRDWLAANMKEPAQRKAKLLLLDANGALLRSFEAKELRTAKPAQIARELKKAQKTNDEHLAAAAPKKH